MSSEALLFEEESAAPLCRRRVRPATRRELAGLDDAATEQCQEILDEEVSGFIVRQVLERDGHCFDG